MTKQRKGCSAGCPQRALSIRPPAAPCRVSVVQLAGPCCATLLRPLHTRGSPALPPALVSLLQDPRVVKAGVGIAEDVRRLAADYGVAVRVGGWVGRRCCRGA